MSGRLVLLTTTHRVPVGVLTWPAWRLLTSGARVHAATADHPLAPHLAEAGVTVEPLPASGGVAGTVRALLDAAAAGGDAPVVWLGSPDGDPGLSDALAYALSDDAGLGRPVPEVEVLPGSYDLPGARLLDLVAVMDRLRSPGGCPWDAKQTHESLLPYLLEETYETVEAVETGDRAHLREELGDLLLQVAFHARLAEEHPDDPFGVDEVAGDIVDKLVRRHPHVFGDAEVADEAEVRDNWEVLKAAEKGRESAVDGVPLGQPALALAAKLLSRTEKAGLDVPAGDAAGAEGPATAREPDPLAAAGVDPADPEAVGALLLRLVAAARHHGVDAEQALRRAARAYADRVRATETDTRS